MIDDMVMATATIPGSRTDLIKEILNEFGEKNVALYKPNDKILCVVMMQIPNSFENKEGQQREDGWKEYVKSFCENL